MVLRSISFLSNASLEFLVTQTGKLQLHPVCITLRKYRSQNPLAAEKKRIFMLPCRLTSLPHRAGAHVG